MKLRRFYEGLVEITDEIGAGRDSDLRPFVCDGSPLACDAFVVGINPASSGVPFWQFWDDEKGFDKERWYQCYLTKRPSGKPSRTRKNMDSIVNAAPNTRILETNLYCVPTSDKSKLTNADRNKKAFEYLLSEIAPKIIVLHGDEVREHFEKNLGCSNMTWGFSCTTINKKTVQIATICHLVHLPEALAKQLGKTIEALCATTRSTGLA